METELKGVDKKSGFVYATILVDGDIYEGVLFNKGKEKQNEKTSQDLVSS